MGFEIAWTFGELESVLASVHGIDQSKRTAFQSRLKNFHRLGYPVGFHAVKGKAATYTPLQIIEMALAVEMTQLGLPPERASWVLARNRWPILMATEIVGRELRQMPDAFSSERGLAERALSMFLYFDPTALNPLTLHLPAKVLPDLDEAANSFFYGGMGIVREGIAAWTSGQSARLSLINLTAMAGNVATSPFDEGSNDDLAYRRDFFRLLEESAFKTREEWGGGDEAEEDYVFNLLEREMVTDPASLADHASIPLNRAVRYCDEFRERWGGGAYDSNPQT
ncbi:hypothetical protein [Erythrobacter sp. EC-HK427]|uniref:hypothetical protein n=1 Tax=Erythrobacter sp. EC-HK427 TaxID=2038396 RepID=UPI00125227F7|nr:hypothetical protein [Erythrobacter sp. EC-HK427]VVT18087.1 hypothetical protein ERY430_80108 [Erythrobacter sp. EC-HK427]